MAVEKKEVNDYLKLCQQIDTLIEKKEVLESAFKAHFEETGDMTICNLLEVQISKNPPKLVHNTEGSKVTEDLRKNLCNLLEGTDFVKTSTGLEIKKIHEQKETNKTLKQALKKANLTTDQSEKINFGKLVAAVKKGK